MSKGNAEMKVVYTPVGCKLVFAGVSSLIGTCFIQPLRLIKVRMQLASERISTYGVAKVVIRKEGFFSLYNGISASLLKSGFIAPIRLAIYYHLFHSYSEAHNGWSPTYYTKLGFGVLAGTVAGCLMMPPELVFVRMANDGTNPVEVKRKYRHTFDALKRIVKEEGAIVLYRGVWFGTLKHATSNFAQLAVYNKVRQKLKRYYDGFKLHLCCAAFSGLVAAVVSLPFDKIKTEIQNATKVDTPKSIASRFQKRGYLSLWSGFTPYYLTITIHTVIVYHFVEYFNKVYINSKLTEDDIKLQEEKKKLFDDIIKNFQGGTTLKKLFGENGNEKIDKQRLKDSEGTEDGVDNLKHSEENVEDEEENDVEEELLELDDE